MSASTPHRAIVIALAVNAALLSGILLVLVARQAGPARGLSIESAALAAQPNPQPIAGGGGIYLMPAQFGQNRWGCLVMDIDAQTLCAYEFLTGKKMLELVAARNFRFDRRLENFNTNPPPAEVLQLLNNALKPPRKADAPAGEQPAGDDAANH